MTSLLALPVAACSAGLSAPSPTGPPSPAVSPSTSASSLPTPVPDDEQVVVSAAGVGDYDLQAIPVALLHNLADHHAATQVIAHFTVRGPGGTYALDAAPVSLTAGQVLAVAALCTSACQSATAAAASVSVGGWEASAAVAVSSEPATFVCGTPCSGTAGYEGEASGSLTGQVVPGTLVNLFASCASGTGAIVGGGVTQIVWAGTQGSTGSATPPAESVAVPVLVTALPTSCELYGAVAV